MPTTRRFWRSSAAGPARWWRSCPGSRTQEVVNNLRWFLRAAATIRRAVPEARFALACFKPHQAEIARRAVDSSGLPAEICVGKTPELMRLADCAMSVSGSVSLELLYHTTPTVILYWISRPAYFVQGFFRKVKYITLVNLLAAGGLEGDGERGAEGSEQGSGVRGAGPGGDIQHSAGHSQPPGLPPDPAEGPVRKSVLSEAIVPSKGTVPLLLTQRSGQSPAEALFPEYLTCEDKSDEIARQVIEWLTVPAKRAERVAALAALKADVAHGGASRRAAEYILAALGLSPFLGKSHCQQVELALEVA